MKTNLQKIGNIVLAALCFVSAMVVLWFLASWVNVLMHNDPLTGDFQYASWNMFTLLFPFCR